MLLDDVQTARDALKGYYALYIGGMGARGKNFYNELFAPLRLRGRRRARSRTSTWTGSSVRRSLRCRTSFVDAVALVGPKERFAERIDAFREAGATTLLVSTRDPAALRAVAELTQ